MERLVLHEWELHGRWQPLQGSIILETGQAYSTSIFSSSVSMLSSLTCIGCSLANWSLHKIQILIPKHHRTRSPQIAGCTDTPGQWQSGFSFPSPKFPILSPSLPSSPWVSRLKWLILAYNMTSPSSSQVYFRVWSLVKISPWVPLCILTWSLL